MTRLEFDVVDLDVPENLRDVGDPFAYASFDNTTPDRDARIPARIATFFTHGQGVRGWKFLPQVDAPSIRRAMFIDSRGSTVVVDERTASYNGVVAYGRGAYSKPLNLLLGGLRDARAVTAA